jgi:hypothetical protein
MAIQQASISIQARSFVGSALVGYQVDAGGNTWDVGGGIDYSISSKGAGISSAITAWHLCQGALYINGRSYFTSLGLGDQINAIAQDYAPEDTQPCPKTVMKIGLLL